MNAFEQKLLAALPGLLAIAEAAAPFFIHSQKATIVLNASEEFASAAVAQFAQTTTPTSAITAAPQTKAATGITVVPSPA